MTPIMKTITRREDETVVLGERLGRFLRAGDVIALVGELGAGKTRLVRGIARGMGIDAHAVSSPTYVIVQEYPANIASSPPLVHVDAHRLEAADGLASLGWDSARDPGAVVVIEWADRIAAELPPDSLRITIEHAESPHERRITFLGVEDWRERIADIGFG